jgi:hypothetical protein
MRWRYGDTRPVVAAVDAATVIEIGDLVYQEVDDARPASAQADQGTESGNQQLFATKFLGVAMQRSPAGDTDPVRVATSGVFEFGCPGTSFQLGDLVGVDEDSSGAKLCDQQVAKVATSPLAIGRVAKRVPDARESVLIEICSTVMSGGVEGTSRTGV